MKKPNEDKLDEIIRNNSLKANLIKWWNVNMHISDQKDGDADEDSSSVDEEDAFSENNTVLYESILKDNSRDEDPFEKAMKQVQEEEVQSLEEANKVYERLLQEAQMDEDKKWQEIEEMQRKAETGEN
ncbi:MAG: hypothetical protein K2K20_06355 [Lachnospiraceae bacterium]|nr:hypothetical protein [Lachnospiraceae bacterium]